MNYEIKITGQGTPNQLAISLLEIGRKFQIADLNGTFHKEFNGLTMDDSLTITEISDEYIPTQFKIKTQ